MRLQMKNEFIPWRIFIDSARKCSVIVCVCILCVERLLDLYTHTHVYIFGVCEYKPIHNELVVSEQRTEINMSSEPSADIMNRIRHFIFLAYNILRFFFLKTEAIKQFMLFKGKYILHTCNFYFFACSMVIEWKRQSIEMRQKEVECMDSWQGSPNENWV